MTDMSLLTYADSFEHIAEELRLLDLRIACRVLRLRQMQTLSNSGGTYRYIAHEEVDLLLSAEGELVNTGMPDPELAIWHNHVTARTALSAQQGIYLTLPRLAQMFSLTWFEIQAVIICLAPELRHKYDKLYAYLQDDVTHKKPSIDLVLDLLCDTEAERWRARVYLGESAPLIKKGLLQLVDDPQSASGSSGAGQFLKLDPHILSFLLGHNTLDSRLSGIVHLLTPEDNLSDLLIDPALKVRATRLIDLSYRKGGGRVVFYLRGMYGVGKRELALALCGQLSCLLLSVNVECLLDDAENAPNLLRWALRQALLLQAAVYLEGADSLLCDDCKAGAIRRRLVEELFDYDLLMFLAGEKAWTAQESFEGMTFHTLELPMPPPALREAAWKTAFEELALQVLPQWTHDLAEQFRLTPRQIKRAAAALPDVAADLDCVTLQDLYRAAREQSNRALEQLAARVIPHYQWDDLILPDEKIQQLRELCIHVRGAHHVFENWGFGEKLVHGRGISALFSGKPGTGKTMAAEVIARELGLELYKIDLSNVVSKYIGETEKNLATIFREAETSNAVLFFDEADALFGRRTEISDAHDRYANIETSYLLQRMETYDGLAILATNFRDNLDEAFTRRIRFIVEFPFPDAAQRADIWRRHFPKRAPLSPDVDFDQLAAQFPLAGGSIRNVVLGAAFFAVEGDTPISTTHIMQAAQREYEKIGKLWDAHSERLK